MEYSMESTLFLVCSIASIFTAGMSSIDTTSPSKNVNFEAARSFCTSIALLSHAKLAAPLGAVIPSAAVTGSRVARHISLDSHIVNNDTGYNIIKFC